MNQQIQIESEDHGEFVKFFQSPRQSKTQIEEDDYTIISSNSNSLKNSGIQNSEKNQPSQFSTGDGSSMNNVSLDYHKNFNDLEDEKLPSYSSVMGCEINQNVNKVEEEHVSDLSFENLANSSDSGSEKNSQNTPQKQANQKQLKSIMKSTANKQQPSQQKQTLNQSKSQKSVHQYVKEKSLEYERTQNLQRQRSSNDEQKKETVEKRQRTLSHKDIKRKQNQQVEVNSQQSQLKAQEIINNGYMDRKRQSYQIMQYQSKKRSEFTGNYKELTKSIMNEVLTKFKYSKELMGFINKYFHNKRDLEYSLGNAIKNSNSRIENYIQQQDFEVGKNSYSQFLKQMQEIDCFSEAQGEKNLQLSQCIEQDIIKQIETEQSDQGLLQKQICQTIEKHQQSLQKIEQKLDEKRRKYDNVFLQGSDSGKKKSKKKDLYEQEVKLRNEAQVYLTHLKQYGKYIMQAWNESKKMEIKRLQLIQQCFKLYVQKFSEVYQSSVQIQNCKDALEKIKAKYFATQNYDIKQSIEENQINYLKSHFHDKEIDENIVNSFLSTFNFPQLNIDSQHSLVLKKYKGFQDVGTIGLTWKPIEMIFTADDFLLFYENDDHQKLKPSTMKIICENIRFQKRKNNNSEKNKCYIVEKQAGGLFSTKKQILIKFADSDTLEEFKIYIQRYCPSENLEV